MTSPAIQVGAGGLLSRKPRWGLTVRGWIVSVVVVGLISVTMVLFIHRFLALNHPLRGGILIVEGWIPEYALSACGRMFKENSYEQVFTVGGPVGMADYPPAEDDTYAYVAGRRLARLGVKESDLHIVPTTQRTRDRTYSSAVAVREWLVAHHQSPTNVTVATLGPHARRSRLLFEKAFAGHAKVGVISVENREYDPAHWWRYSEGVKEVISEAGAYLYARLLFHPDAHGK
jgi:hypothetical protein